MGAFKDNLQFTAEEYVRSRKERLKWMPLLLGFIAITFLAGFVKGFITNDADILAGRATVEKYLKGNIVRTIVMVLIIIAFVLVVIKTWKGMASSTEQLIFTIATGLFLVLMFIVTIKPVFAISKELKHPTTKELSSYTLCTDADGMHYVAFNDDGAVLLAIPADKYTELQKGSISNKKNTGQAHEIVVEDGYKNIQYYESDITITYYNKSIIYESAALKTS